MTERRRSRLTLWATTGFVVLQIGWLLVMAPFAGIDEFDHAYRASSVADGHVLVRHEMAGNLTRGDLLPVRRDVAEAASPACIDLPYTRTYECWPAKDIGDGHVLISSAASRYNPAFYVIAGLAAKPFHGNAALYAMRIASILVCAALFAMALQLTNAWARTFWPTAALLAAAMPTTIYSTALAAPNGVEMISGLTLWAAVVHRLKVKEPGSLGYVVLGLSAALLVNMHTLGAFWLVLTFAAGMCLVGWRTFVARMRPRSAVQWLVAGSTVTASAFEVAWVVLARPNDPSGPVILHTNVWTLLPREMLLWPLQAIGAFPYRDEPAPLVVYAAAVVVLVGLIALAVSAGRRAPRLVVTMAFVVITSYAVPIVLTVATFSRLGLNWQGRYGMPYSAGFFLLLGLTLDHARVPVRKALLDVALAAWLFAHVVSQVHVLGHQAADPVLARTNWWAPSPLVIVALGCVAWLMWRRALHHALVPASDAAEPAAPPRTVDPIEELDHEATR